MHSAYPELPLAYIGHSVDAHLVPLAPNGYLVTRNIFISSNNVYYGYRPGYNSIFWMKYLCPLWWYVYLAGISFTDDTFATEKTLTSSLRFFTGSNAVHRRFKPRDISLKSVDYMGFFVDGHQEVENNL
ncbi:hypothetical protein K7432_002167 [Basidiobolus ranarum]|uniref:Uncharacterized protein n=1 Tax=Basidiobolus ranarum TaxID=34480 RepID=A0ABR2W8B3_9FUNG